MIELDITTPPDRSAKEWDEECRRLYLDLKLSMDEGEVEPKPHQGISDHRSLGLLFSSLVLDGVNLGIFSGIFQVVKTWLDNRPTCEITMTYGDGTVLKVPRLSLDQALKLHEQHALTPAPAGPAATGSTPGGHQ